MKGLVEDPGGRREAEVTERKDTQWTVEVCHREKLVQGAIIHVSPSCVSLQPGHLMTKLDLKSYLRLKT